MGCTGKRTIYAVIACMILAYAARVNAGENAAAENGKPLSLEEFIRQATEADTVFEEILIDRLKLDYRKDLYLPAKDFVVSLKGQYDLFLDQDRSAIDSSISLEKLFPFTGTEIEISYRDRTIITGVIGLSSVVNLMKYLMAQIM